MRRNITSGLRGQRVIAVRVDGVTATAVLTEGTGQVTLTDNGTGDWTLTFNDIFVRVPSVVTQVVTPSTRVEVQAAGLLVNQVRLLAYGYNNTTPTDAVFHVIIAGWDRAL